MFTRSSKHDVFPISTTNREISMVPKTPGKKIFHLKFFAQILQMKNLFYLEKEGRGRSAFIIIDEKPSDRDFRFVRREARKNTRIFTSENRSRKFF